MQQATSAVSKIREILDSHLSIEKRNRPIPLHVYEQIARSVSTMGFLIDMLNYQIAIARELFVFDSEAGEFTYLNGRRTGAQKLVLHSVPRPSSDKIEATVPLPRIRLVETNLPVQPVPHSNAVDPHLPVSMQGGEDDGAEILDIFLDEAASVLDRSSEPSIDITDSAPIFTFKGIGKQFKEVLSIRTLRLLIIAQMLLFIAFAGLFATAVTYFTRTTPLSLANAGAITGAIGGAGLVLGAFLGAAIGDALAKKKESYRITISALALGISVPCLFFFVLAPEVPVKIGFFFVINLCNIIALANLGAATADVLPASRRGSGFAVSQLLITLGSAFGAFFVQGIVSQIVVSALGGETERTLRLGISIGVGSLLIPLLIGSLLLLKARSSYDQDAAAARAEAKDGFATPSAPIH